MTNLSYKNFFITKAFHDIDEKRAEMKLDCVLPLTEKERRLYVELKSLKLVKHDYKMLFGKSLFLLLTTLHVLGILMADYSLFWFLSIVQFHGNQIEDVEFGRQGDFIVFGYRLFIKFN